MDYAEAIRLYYGGSQKAMAERLEVSPPWLSRYLVLSKMPGEILSAFASKRDIRERHARALKPLLGNPDEAQAVLAEARQIAQQQAQAAKGQGAYIDAAEVFKRLTAAAKVKKAPAKVSTGKLFSRAEGEPGIHVTRQGKKVKIAFDADLPEDALRGAFEAFLKARET